MRSLSNEALSAIFAQDTEKVFYILLTIKPIEEGYEPIYIYNSNETENGEPRIISHNGHDFVAFPFKINLPGEGGDASTEITLTIANVDRSLTETIRQIRRPLDITLEVVLSDHTEITEAGPWNMSLTNITGDALTLEGTIIKDRFLDEPFPKDRMDATIFPAMF